MLAVQKERGCGVVSTYAEMDRLRKLARPLYLELRALGLELRAEEDPEDPTGYALLVGGLRSLSPSHADRVRRRVEENKGGLVRVLAFGKWGGDLGAVRGEGAA